jgi:hypothetical protein
VRYSIFYFSESLDERLEVLIREMAAHKKEKRARDAISQKELFFLFPFCGLEQFGIIAVWNDIDGIAINGDDLQ